ncbi:MAG: site-specific integrase [Clostridia bacterium]|nr:site-specific integrase [Clostridia bacterium]
MVKITRLPSGSYRARVHIGGGKYKSITGKDKKEVQLQAARYEAENKLSESTLIDRITVGEAIDKYIETKTNVLSPSTIRGYKALRTNAVPELMAIELPDLTPELVQRAINAFAVDKSPKYTRNVHGLISSALKQYRPDLQLHTTMPQKKKSIIAIPTEDEMQKLFVYAKGTDIELPIYLGACCGMRRSEILGLKWEDVDLDKGTLFINEALVLNKDNEQVSKGTKTIAGTRMIRMYPFVKEVLERAPRDGKYVVTLKGHQIYQRFTSALEACGIKHYRFHDLRHYLVSVMLSLNIPKKYIADYVGHETERMIDEVYGHIMAQKKTDVEDILQDYFSNSVTKSDTVS